ncbi:MAG: hypothetical protein QMD03_05510 [Syntrophales bacterium]|nr:hypothetical protein [Syntrophales bacterium]
MEQVSISHIDGNNSHPPVGTADQSGYGKSLLRVRSCSSIEKKVSRINDQNRLSIGSYFFYKYYPPGETTQFFVSSDRTGKDVSS